MMTRLLFKQSFIFRGLYFLALITSALGCAPVGGFLNEEAADAIQTSSWRDYWIVANGTTRAVTLTDSNGVAVRDLMILDPNGGDVPTGIGYDGSGDEALVTVEGTDRVMTVNLSQGVGSETLFAANSNIGGAAVTMTGVAVLLTGDVLVNDGNTTERLFSNGLRDISNGWPRTLQTTSTGLAPLPSGGFLLCSSGSDVVRTYDSTGATQIGTAAYAAAPDVLDCAVHQSTGRIAAIYNNGASTADVIRVYSSETLVNILWTNLIGATLGNPRTLSYRSNGNLIVIDGTSNAIVELDGNSGNIVRAITSSAISGIRDLEIVQ